MKTQSFELQITQQDIENARLMRPSQQIAEGRATPACPVCLALQRVTDSQWKIVNASTVMQIDAPFRIGFVSDDLKQKLQEFRSLNRMVPGCFTVQIDQGMKLPFTQKTPGTTSN